MEQKSINLTIRITEEKLSTGEPVFVALCKELDIASQGDSLEEAKENIRRSIDLWLDTASTTEVKRKMLAIARRKSQTYVAQVQIPVQHVACVAGV